MEKHALSEPDREVCGFVYQSFYHPLRNLASDHSSFYADPADVAMALVRYGGTTTSFIPTLAVSIRHRKRTANCRTIIIVLQ